LAAGRQCRRRRRLLFSRALTDPPCVGCLFFETELFQTYADIVGGGGGFKYDGKTAKRCV